MARFVIQRLLGAIPTLWLVGTLIFVVLRLAPGDPAVAMLGENATAEALARVRAAMGLDQPLAVQYGAFLKDALQGDLGRSLVTGRGVTQQVLAALPYTLELIGLAMVISLVIGIPAGVLAAVRHNGFFDYIGRFLTLLGLSMPAFYLGVLLLIVFALHLGWFPVLGQPRGGLGTRLYYAFLPALTLGLVQAAVVARMTRASMLEVLHEEYIRTARAKGVSEMGIQYRHALRNVLIPVVTVLGLYVGTVLAGTVLTETVFNRPGMGRLLVGAIAQRDYPLIQGGLMIYAAMVVVVNTLVDILYGVFDPTVRYD